MNLRQLQNFTIEKKSLLLEVNVTLHHEPTIFYIFSTFDWSIVNLELLISISKMSTSNFEIKCLIPYADFRDMSFPSSELPKRN